MNNDNPLMIWLAPHIFAKSLFRPTFRSLVSQIPDYDRYETPTGMDLNAALTNVLDRCLGVQARERVLILADTDSDHLVVEMLCRGIDERGHSRRSANDAGE